MAVAGSLTYKTEIDTDGFEKGVGKLGGVSKASFAKVAAAAAAAATAIKVVVDATKQSVEAFGRYEQLTGGVQAMFGGVEKGAEQINKVMQTASTAYRDLTMSQNEYFNSFNSTYPLIKSSIDDQNAAIDVTNRMLTLESDLANTFGYSMETASNAINWALKGTYSYVDNLNIGIKGTKEGFAEAAAAAGYAKKVEQLTSEEILDVLEKTANQYGVLGRTAAEAAGTLEGSAKSAKAAWEDVQTALATGENIEQAFNNFTESASNYLNNLIPVVQNVITNLINNLPQFLELGMQFIGSIVMGIMQSLPQLIISGVDAVLSMVDGIIDNLDKIIDAGIEMIIALIEGLIEALPRIIDKMPEIVEKLASALIRALPKIAYAGGRIVAELIAGIIVAVPKLITAALKIVTTINEKVKELPFRMLEIGKAMIDGIWQGITNSIGWIKNKISEWIGDVVGFFKDKLGIHSPSRVMADAIGKFIPQGIAVGIEADTDSALNAIDKMNNEIMNKMNRAVNAENGALNATASVKSNNSMFGMIQAQFNLDSSIELDGTRLGRTVTPYVSKTIKLGGAY